MERILKIRSELFCQQAFSIDKYFVNYDKYFVNHLKNIQNTISKNLIKQENFIDKIDIQHQWQSSFEKYLHYAKCIDKSLYNTIKQFCSYYPDFLKNIQNTISKNLIKQENFIDKIDIQHQWQSSFEKYLHEISNIIKSQHIDSSLRFQINNDGTIVIDEEIYSENELKENIDKISKELAYSISWNEFIEKLKELLESPYKIIRFLAITIYVTTAFLGNLTNLANYFGVTYSDLKNILSENFLYSEQINTSKRDFKLKVRKTIIKDRLNTPSYYRFVIANILYVRNGPSRKAEIIDELPRGKIVKILVKKRRWCLVQYEDEDTGEIKKGWVFLRYLERFKK